MAARQFAARVSGATEGVTRSGGQAVFTSSVAKDSASGKAQPAGRSAAPATRSASGGVWSGYAARGSSSLSTADVAAAPQSSGLGSAAVGMVVLGVGLAGLVGGFAVAAVRRQRVAVRRSSGGNER